MEKMMLLGYIAHFIGDYSLQTDFIATHKAKSYRYTLIHCAMYMIPSLLGWGIIGFGIHNLVYICMLSMMHMIIDLGKCFVMKHNREKNFSPFYNEKFIYILDQSLHCLSIYMICVLWQPYSLSLIPIEILQVVLYISIFIRPVYITYKKLFCVNEKISGILSLDDKDIKVMILMIAVSYGYSFYLGICICVVGLYYCMKILKWNSYKSYELIIGTAGLCCFLLSVFKQF